MLTLVMSGGANFGAMQAGALEVILETGFQPEMAVGTSAGALNAILIASDPTPAGVQRLIQLWQSVTPNDVGKATVVTGLRRLVASADGLIDDRPLARFLQRSLPSVPTFGELAAICGVRAYAPAICVETAEMIVFGDRPSDNLLDGAMSSCAVPPFLPPWKIGGQRYFDGGIYTKLPLLVAIERGATQIVALNIRDTKGMAPTAHGIIAVAYYASSLMTRHQVHREISEAQKTDVPVRVIDLHVPPDIAIWDYTQPNRLIKLGRELARKNLEEQPLKIYNPLERLLHQFSKSLNHKDRI